jgi:hypothetical protein
MQSRRVIPQMVGGLLPLGVTRMCPPDGSGELTKGKKFNKITDILLIFLLVVVIGVDFTAINPAFSFLADTKKRVFIKFLLTKTYWILAN